MSTQAVRLKELLRTYTEKELDEMTDEEFAELLEDSDISIQDLARYLS